MLLNNSILLTTVVFILMISLLVVVHEWGHFIAARLCKIRVDEFSLGFGPRLARLGKRGDTEYNIRWILLGGYVKIAGMEADEEPLINARDKAKALLTGTDPNKAEVPLMAENRPDRAETDEQRERDQIDGFYSRPGWQRALVIFAGPLMSFVLGIVLLCSAGMLVGLPISGSSVASVIPGSVADHIGLKAGDRITMVNTTAIPNDDGTAILTIIHSSKGKPVRLTVLRDGKIIDFTGVPEANTYDPSEGMLGFQPTPGPPKVLRRVGFDESMAFGYGILQEWVGGIAERFRSWSGINRSTGSVIQMISYTNDAVKQGPLSVAVVAAELSLSLALFNILPIPVLDGGHLLVIGVEGIRRGRRLTLQQQQNFMLAGLAIILTIFILVTSRDAILALHGKLQHLP